MQGPGRKGECVYLIQSQEGAAREGTKGHVTLRNLYLILKTT